MHVTMRSDYALRALLELATAARPGVTLVKAEGIAARQQIPLSLLFHLLGGLRAAALVRSQRGRDGGYRLARPASQISIAEVIRAVDRQLPSVDGWMRHNTQYPERATAVRELWATATARVDAIFARVTLADVVHGELPDVGPAGGSVGGAAAPVPTPRHESS